MKYIFLIIVLIISHLTSAQSVKLTVRTSDNIHLPYAHAYNLRTEKYIITDNNGEAILDSAFAKTGDTIQITYIGHKKYSLVFSEYVNNEVIITLIPEVYILNEYVKINFTRAGIFKVKARPEYYMPFKFGSLIAVGLPIDKDSIEIESIRLFTQTNLDSIEVRLSVLDTIDYNKHLSKGKVYMLYGNKILIEEMNTFSISESQVHYVLVELFPYCDGQLKLTGYFPEKTILPHCYMRGNTSNDNMLNSGYWMIHPLWVPRIEFKYKY